MQVRLQSAIQRCQFCTNDLLIALMYRIMNTEPGAEMWSVLDGTLGQGSACSPETGLPFLRSRFFRA